MALMSFIAGFLLLFAQDSNRALDGGYLREDGNNGYEGYYFSKDGQFFWFSTSGNDRAMGQGRYSIPNDRMELTFEQARRRFDLQAESAVPTNEPKSVVQVNAIHSTGVPFAGLKFTLTKSNVTGETDPSGTATVTIDNPTTKDNIHFEVDGYGTYDTSVELKGTNNFYAFVIDDAIRYRENTKLNFNLEYSRKNIKLVGESDTKSFKKVSRRSFMKLYHGT